jgi:hypothetical protein
VYLTTLRIADGLCRIVPTERPTVQLFSTATVRRRCQSIGEYSLSYPHRVRKKGDMTSVQYVMDRDTTAWGWPNSQRMYAAHSRKSEQIRTVMGCSR